jgi:RNA polymerase sigma-70 factor (ECF subfamily)
LADFQGAEDLVQTTWVRALEHEGAVHSRNSWLRQVLRNEHRMDVRGRLRAEARQRAAATTDEAMDVERCAQQREIARLITGLVETLDEDVRDVVQQRYFDGHTAAEIARKHDIPAGTVRWRLKRGMDRLREQLDAHHGGKRALWAGAFVPGSIAPTFAGAMASEGSNVVANAAGTTKGTSAMLTSPVLMKLLIGAGVAGAAAVGAVAVNGMTPAAVPTETVPENGATLPADPNPAIQAAVASKPPRDDTTDLAQQRWARRIEEIRAAHAEARLQAGASTSPGESETAEDCVHMCTDEDCLERLANNVLSLVEGCDRDVLSGWTANDVSLTAHVIAAPDIGTVVESVELDGGEDVPTEVTECLTQSMYTLELEAEEGYFEQDITVLLQKDLGQLSDMLDEAELAELESAGLAESLTEDLVPGDASRKAFVFQRKTRQQPRRER